MSWYYEEKEPLYDNYLALAYTILEGGKDIPNFTTLQDKQEAKKRIKEIKELRASGGKTELETIFKKNKNNSHNKKTYVYDMDLNKKYEFDSKKIAAEKLNISRYKLTKIKDYKIINNYIVSEKKIKLKQIRPGDFISMLDTGYPRGLFYIENNDGYLSICNKKGEKKIKKHDCKEAAILYLLDID